MRKRLILSLLLVPMIILMTPVLAQDDGTTTETSTVTSNSLYQFQQWHLYGGYVAAGIGMRSLGYGEIAISGIPTSSSIVAAYLYWDILDDVAESKFKDGNFNGSPITGTMIGYGWDPCWGQNYNFAYRADVTSLVSGNGLYTLTGFASGRTDGLDPWTPDYTSPLIEGASLIVVYSNPTSPYVAVIINDASQPNNALTGNGASDTTTFSGFTADGTGAQITYVIADGQNEAATDPSPTFNIVNNLPANLWDGSDPQAIADHSHGNLWDTETYDVSLWVAAGDTTATTTVGSTRDCYVWVAAVLAVNETPPGPIPLFSNAILMLPIAVIAGAHLVKRKRKTHE